MDTFCIERGTLLDNPELKTLERPDAHSVHCLVDVPRCYESGFEVLVLPAEPAGGKTYAGGTRRHASWRDMGKVDLDAQLVLGQKEMSRGAFVQQYVELWTLVRRLRYER